MIKNISNLLTRSSKKRQDTPLNNLEATHRWIAQLNGVDEATAHRRVTELLAQFSHGLEFTNPQLIHTLALTEHSGSKLQYSLIKQFFLFQSVTHADTHSIWTEIVSFYRLMFMAYQQLAMANNQTTKPGAALPTLILRALHYQGKLMQWGYMRHELPTPTIWKHLNDLYLVAIQHGFVDSNMVLKGSAFASCKAVYARILLLHLMHPVGIPAQDIELLAYWSWKWREHLLLEEDFNAQLHTHYMAVHEARPPLSILGKRPHGELNQFFSLDNTLLQAQTQLADKDSKHASDIKLYGVPYQADTSTLLKHAIMRLSSKLQLSHHLSTLPGSVEIRCSDTTVVKLLIDPMSGKRIDAKVIAIGHPDEAYFNLSIVEDTSNCRLEINQILIVDAASFAAPMLVVIRWIEKKGERLITLGIERLGSSPHLVTFQSISDPAQSAHIMDAPHEGFIAISVNEPATLFTFNAVQQRYADMLDGDVMYRIRLRSAVEQNSMWLQIPFTLLSKTKLSSHPKDNRLFAT